MNNSKLMGLILLTMLLIAACQTASDPAQTGRLEAPPLGSTDQPVASTDDVAAPEATGSPPESPQQPPAQVQVRTQLTATDPATVNLTSGNPKFVEFFAFW